MKKTSNGRGSQNIYSGISQQPMNRSSLNFKIRLNGQNLNQNSFKLRQLQLEDDTKILKMEYLSNYWSDLSQILNSSLGDRTKICNGR